MVRVFAFLKPLIRLLMKFYGLTPQVLQIEPGMIMKIWVPSKPKNKPAVVFLHGFAADGIFSWQSQVLALSANYAVYVPDLLFFGGSITDKPDRSTAFQAEFIAKGLEKVGVKRCTVVGLSYGASVGFQMAKNYPELVECVVASDTVVELTQSVSRAAVDKYGYSSLQELLLPTSVEGLKAFFSIANNKPPSLPGFVAEDFLREFYINRKERAELLDAWIIRDEEVTPISLNQRIHLLWGDDDKIFNSEVAENTKKQLGGNVTTLQYIKDGGHAVQVDQPAIYNEEIKKILASLHTKGKED